MENWSKWKFIKVGFLLAIGFIIPQLVVILGGSALSMFAVPIMVENSFKGDTEEMFSGITSDFDVTEQIQIGEYREEARGNKLHIFGTVKNTGEKKASSIQLEAELFNSKGEFVFECSEYISKNLKQNEVENFQITCGCGKEPIPEYTEINLRIVSASNY